VTVTADGDHTTNLGLEDVTDGRRGSPTSTTARRPQPSTAGRPGCSCRSFYDWKSAKWSPARAHEPGFRDRASVVKDHHD
jgi:hypothetical protein